MAGKRIEKLYEKQGKYPLTSKKSRSIFPGMLTPFGRIMKRAKWTPGDVRSICQVDQKTVWSWRTGKTLPKAQNIADMLAALNRAGIPGAFADFLPKDRRAA